MVKRKRKAKKSFYFDLYESWCKRCGICVAFCPQGVLQKDERGYPRPADPEACTGCKWCELRCPDFAIAVLEEGHG